jgi:hypothetical protein
VGYRYLRRAAQRDVSFDMRSKRIVRGKYVPKRKYTTANYYCDKQHNSEHSRVHPIIYHKYVERVQREQSFHHCHRQHRNSFPSARHTIAGNEYLRIELHERRWNSDSIP